MNDIFLVLGYRIPKNIFHDDNYKFYLNLVFNKIYSIAEKDKKIKPLIIFCGGKTDTFKPYKRNEADEMIKFFNSLRRRSGVSSATKDWLSVSEKKSLSTLENLVNSKNIISQRGIKKANLFIFCEQTRENRVRKMAHKIFNKNYSLKVVPLDFDTSNSRYLPFDFIVKKEMAELKHSLWALKNEKNFKKHHDLFVEKLEYLKKFRPDNASAVKKWWEEKLRALKS